MGSQCVLVHLQLELDPTQPTRELYAAAASAPEKAKSDDDEELWT